jgi:type I restriction enzyme M protein
MVEATVEKTGKVAVIVPHGVLFRSGSEGKIRQQLVEDNLVEAVIGLPPNLFYGTSISAAILILNRGKENADTLFVDASAYFAESKNQNTLRESDIARISDAVNNFATIPRFAIRVPLAHIKHNEYSLNLASYVDIDQVQEQVRIQPLISAIRGLETELGDVRRRISQHLKELGYEA